MTVINVGSINLDHVYSVPHLTQAGETQAASAYQVGLGGKGLNQSVALHRAGAAVLHLGAVGDQATRDALSALGLDTRGIDVLDAPTGHAIIQVDAKAENNIILFAGANAALTNETLDAHLKTHSGWVLLQNETNATETTFALAARYGLSLAFNPAPVTAATAELPLHQLSLLIVNRVELQQLSGAEEVPEALSLLRERCPDTEIVVTLGRDGALCSTADQEWFAPIFIVDAQDTTGAGDTFVGYYLAERLRGQAPMDALRTASAASALCVSDTGAVNTIPSRDAVQALLDQGRATFD